MAVESGSGRWKRWSVGGAALVAVVGVVAAVGLVGSRPDSEPVAVGGGATSGSGPEPTLEQAAEPPTRSSTGAEPDVRPPGYVILNDTELTWLDEEGRPTDAMLPNPQFQPRSYAGSYAPRIADGGNGSLLYTYVDDEVMIDGSSSWSDAGLSEGDPIGTPTLRRIDSEGESTVVSGAATFAVSDDGRLAYVRGMPPEARAERPYVADIVVIGDDGGTEVWSPHQGEWELIAFGGDYVIAYDYGNEDEYGEGDEDGRYWILTRDDAREIDEGVPLAVDPSRTRLLLGPEPADRQVGEPEGAVLRIVDIASLEEVATLQLPNSSELGTDLLIDYPASWVGDVIAIPSYPGVLVLSFADGELSVMGMLPIEGNQKAWGVDALVVDESPTVLVVVADNDYEDQQGAGIGTAQRCTLASCEVMAEQTSRRFNLEIDRVRSLGRPRGQSR